MSEQDDAVAKLEAFLEVLDDLIGETLAAGVSEAGLRRTLLARALYQFKSHPSDGIAALDHFRKALERQLIPSSGPDAG
jgi:phytoene/squalene synthetase